MLDLKTVGNRLMRIRELQGYSRESLSLLTDISPRFIYDIELGNKGMSIDTLINICRSLHISSDYLLFGSSSEGEKDEISALISTCPDDKLPILKEIIKTYIEAAKD